MSSSWLTTNYHRIGLRYLWLALGSVCLGMVISVVQRMPPGISEFAGAAPLSLVHGTLMVFFVLSIAPQMGLGTCCLPRQIGAPEMALPGLTAVGWWTTLGAFVAMLVAFALRPEAGLNVWTGGAALFCLAALCNGLNFAVTVIDLRGKGMSFPRLPVTVWAWLVNAVLSLLVYSVLLGVCMFVLSARLLDGKVFGAGETEGGVLEWQRLFWLFAQAQVYIAILPCFGIVTHLLATFARRPVWKYSGVVLALCAAGLVDFCVVGERLFASGLNPAEPLPFGALAGTTAFPVGVLVIAWLRMLWDARLQRTTAMLFALGFVSLFLSGGFSGIFLARHDLRGIAASDALITGHFHLVMGVAATFAVIAALFFWFPKLFGRALDERLGKLHFWLTFSGVYAVFMSMHWMGLLEHSGAVAVTPSPGFLPFAAGMRQFIAVALLITVTAQGIFLFNFVVTLLARPKEQATANPWGASTLEWTERQQPADGGVGEVTVYRGAYEFFLRASSPAPWPEFVPQHLTPEQAAGHESQT